MQDHSQGAGSEPGNVVSLSAWRARRGAPAGRPRTPVHDARQDLALSHLNDLHLAVQRTNGLLLTALYDLDTLVQDLGQSMAELEGQVGQLHDSLGHSLTRLEVQRRQNDQVAACLASGDLAAMEDCHRRICDERRRAGRTARRS